MSIRLEARNRGTIRLDMDNASLAAKYAREAETAEKAAKLSAANAAGAAERADTAATAASYAAASAQAAAIHPPQPGENGTWLIWDQAGSSYVDSGANCVGVQGERGLKGDTGDKGDKGDKGDGGDKGDDGVSPGVSVSAIAGGHRVMITDADHPQGQSFDVLNGSVAIGTTLSLTSEDAIQNKAIYAGILKAFPTATASGSVAFFPDGADGLPLKKLEVQIVPVQVGSGDPGPENVRSISGWTGCVVTRTGKNRLSKDDIYRGSIGADGTVNVNDTTRCYTAFIKIEPGSTYTFSCESGIVVRAVHTYKRKTQTGDSWNGRILNTSNSVTFTAGSSDNYCRAMLCKTNYSAAITPSEITSPQMEAGATATTYEPYIGTAKAISFPTPPGTVYCGTLTIHDDGTAELTSRPYYASYSGETLVGPWLSSVDVYAEGTTPSTGAQVVDMGGAETVYTFTAEQAATLRGVNIICADCGNVSVEYRADPSLYINGKLTALASMITNIETGMTARKAYAVNDFLTVNNQLYIVIAPIANGGTITPGTNVTATSLGAQLTGIINS